MVCASLQGNVTSLLSILNMTLHMFHILLFTDLIKVYTFALQKLSNKFFYRVGVMLSPCSYRMVLGLRGEGEIASKELGSLPSQFVYQRTPE